MKTIAGSGPPDAEEMEIETGAVAGGWSGESTPLARPPRSLQRTAEPAMIEAETAAVRASAIDHASRQLQSARLGRLAAALAYLLAVALVASPGAPLPLGGAALAGVIVAALIARLSHDVRLAAGTLAAHGLEEPAAAGVDVTAFLLVLLVALLDSAAGWWALRGRAPGVAPVAAALLFAWQWWFYFYWLAPERGGVTPDITGDASKDQKESGRG